MTFDFYDFVAEAERRKSQLGIVADAAATDALRNKGGSRTARKRTLLGRMDERARAAGREPVQAYY